VVEIVYGDPFAASSGGTMENIDPNFCGNDKAYMKTSTEKIRVFIL